MMYKSLSKDFLFFICLFFCYNIYAQKSEKPVNIVIILADDLGYGDLSCYGATRYSTPNLDKMAMDGIRFTNFDVPQPICSASRASILTGCYANRVGVHGAFNPHAKKGLDPSEETIAEVVKKIGYNTMAIGKWHLGHLEKYLPLQQGFDDFLGLPYSNDMVPFYYDGSRNIPEAYKRKLTYPELPLIRGDSKIKELKTLEEQSQLTTLYTETAVQFINENRDHPFFLYLAHSMPHVPLAVSDKFKGKSKQGLYGDVVMEIDWSVGEILKTLKNNNLDKNTLVIFTSDNGPWLNFGNHAGSTKGLREGKGTSFEGGQRVPCIMKFPGTIPDGQVSNKLITSLDILPTIASLVNAPMPKKQIDGINMLPVLKGHEVNLRKELYYYYANNSLEAVRYNNFKLVFPHDYRSYEGVLPGKNGLPGDYSRKTSKLTLYNLRRDPGERYDVKDLYPSIVQKLKELATKARKDLGDKLTGVRGANRRLEK